MNCRPARAYKAFCLPAARTDVLLCSGHGGYPFYHCDCASAAFAAKSDGWLKPRNAVDPFHASATEHCIVMVCPQTRRLLLYLVSRQRMKLSCSQSSHRSDIDTDLATLVETKDARRARVVRSTPPTPRPDIRTGAEPLVSRSTRYA